MPFRIKIIKDTFKTLGVWFAKDMEMVRAQNCDQTLKNLQNSLHIWSMRDLSLKGKITIIKSLALSKITYICSVLHISDKFIEEVNTTIFQFLWSYKKAKVKKTTVIASIENGGLKMPHFQTTVTSLKLSWIKRLCFSQSSLPTFFFKNNNIKQFFNYKQEYKRVKTMYKMPPFYLQILKYWYELTSAPPNNREQVLFETIWHNKYILAGSQPLKNQIMQRAGINKINDIVNDSGELLPLTLLETKYNIKVNYLDYLTVCSAIPKSWKYLLLNDNTQPEDTNNLILPAYIINRNERQLVDVTSLTNKAMYNILIQSQTSTPTCHGKWESTFPNTILDWPVIYKLAFKTTEETKLQTFQWKLINRIIPCRYWLSKFVNDIDELCNRCHTDDTIEHYFYHCTEVFLFWKSFTKWWLSGYSYSIQLSIVDVLFGLHEVDIPDIAVLNYCILVAKRFIFCQKLKDSNVNLSGFLVCLRNKIEIIKYNNLIAGHSSLFEKQWSRIYENIQC